MLQTLQKSVSSIDRMGSRFLPVLRQVRSASTGSALPAKTCLYDFHVENGGKMVEFAGYSMPVEYSSMGIIPSHLHTRKNSSIFDVSHMLQTIVHGKDRFDFMESLTVADVRGLKPNTGTLTVFTNERGGIKDDLIVTNSEDFLYVVSNAGCREKDMDVMKRRIKEMQADGKDVSLEFIEDKGLVAIQGPTMREVLQPLTSIDLSKLGFMSSGIGSVAGIPDCRITRCGYTGEDGVEISAPDTRTRELVETLLQSSAGNPALAGLGARDSLRLEAGLCLYGNDIDEETTPVEATLAWTIHKARRVTGGFPGDNIILRQLKEGVERKRVGFLSSGPPVRGHCNITDDQGNVVGVTTSGCPSPSMGKGCNISMGYVEKKLSKIGTELKIIVRNKPVPAVITKMPFIPTNYFTAQ